MDGMCKSGFEGLGVKLLEWGMSRCLDFVVWLSGWVSICLKHTWCLVHELRYSSHDRRVCILVTHLFLWILNKIYEGLGHHVCFFCLLIWSSKRQALCDTSTKPRQPSYQDMIMFADLTERPWLQNVLSL